MNIMQIDKVIMDRVNSWLTGGYDEQTKCQIREMLQNNSAEVVESFYKNLEFGTGGLRGKMGVGTNRMNIYTVGGATQGLANYLKEVFKDLPEIKVAVACDSRNNSAMFSKTVANVFAANGIKVFLFESLRPTPELSFTIRHFGCQSGVVVTASHNPKIYNGYKAYWDDGGQVVAPHDKNIINHVNSIKSIEDIKWTGGEKNITIIGDDVDRVYLGKIKDLSLSPDIIKQHSDLKIVYTSIHGSGYRLVPHILKEYGFSNVFTVKEQMVPNGNFPTVVNPNPEEPTAMKMGIDMADSVGASLLIATDPDADRIGVAVRDSSGKMILLNGNQTASIVTYYLLTRMKELGRLHGGEFIVKTVVTTDLLVKIAKSFGVDYYNVLTGFKFIASKIKELEGKSKYICGGEESYGFLIGDFVRDKDAISCSAMVCEAAAWAASNGITLYDLLVDIYVEYGFFKEGLLSITKEGKSGAEEIIAMMSSIRNNPPHVICGENVITIADYEKRTSLNVKTGVITKIEYPVSDVLQFITDGDTIVSMRPSGTEPKIKFYFGVREALPSKNDFEKVNQKAIDKIERIKKEMNL
ncbi:MAG: phospho-sugar mutase [Rikenellaceae bacterium]